ncbi:DUF7455 domain-containing protein [Kribbella ginsengisoli]|uniref:DUF7455 domain-containing protein n=1 Tax=Kribbella ginsengisoli TaxID=363865 RepID=UPI003CD07BCE
MSRLGSVPDSISAAPALCDRCGSRACILIHLTAGVLTLCRHHFHRHEDALLAIGAMVEELP